MPVRQPPTDPPHKPPPNPADVAFTCNNKLIGARAFLDTYKLVFGLDDLLFDSARDDDGHGTHTASTAAGNADVDASIFGRFVDETTGIAPRAHIIAYKSLGELGGFTSDSAEAIDQAVDDGVEVINYSVGSGAGLNDLASLAYLFAADAGVFVATSAGNSGPDPATIGAPADAPWVTTVGASTQDRFYQGTVSLGNGVKVTGSSITLGTVRTGFVDAATLGNELCLQNQWAPGVASGKIVLCKRGAIGRSAKSRAVELAGGVGMVLYNASDDDTLFTDNFRVPTVMLDFTEGKVAKDYIARYGARATAKLQATGTVTRTKPRAPFMSIFSSRGPNPSAPSIIKPDVTAPGVQVLAGASPYTSIDFAQGQLFQAISGTSMSGPVVAGLFALLKQAHPNWTPAEAKSALMTTASQDVKDNDRETAADPFDFGAGHVDPGSPLKRGSAFDPGLVYDAGILDYLGFMCDADPSIYVNATATCGALAGRGVPTMAVDLNYPTIGIGALAGTQTVTRTVTNVADRRIKVSASVDQPRGYRVQVSPSTLSIAPGESVSFEVTITNRGSAPIGEWRFGALTWKGGGYAVRSNIAVNASQIAADEVVDGEGVAGSANIAVKFGYTGAYAAEPSGLVPSAPQTGSVVQDMTPASPVFSPADVAAGGAVAFPVNLDNVTYARWELVIPNAPGPDRGDADLDIFLYNSAGQQVAESTSAGTDELLELRYPEAGNYTMYVHGWAVPAAFSPLTFSMDQWIVRNEAGSLTIAAAPASATIGTTGQVTVAWTGLTDGLRYFGSVAHTDGAEVLDQTVVEVNA